MALYGTLLLLKYTNDPWWTLLKLDDSTFPGSSRNKILFLLSNRVSTGRLNYRCQQKQERHGLLSKIITGSSKPTTQGWMNPINITHIENQKCTKKLRGHYRCILAAMKCSLISQR
jgi:hypothetical protein